MVSRVGEVYKVPYVDQNRYFQFVAIDQTQLNSDVVAVFKLTSAPDEIVELDAITSSDIEFFTHTTVNAGVKQSLWEKIGSSDAVDSSGALFKEVYYENGLPDIEPFEADSYHSWIVWNINGEWQHIGADIDKYPNAELGAVFPPGSIVYRIEYGKYEGIPYYGQVR